MNFIFHIFGYIGSFFLSVLLLPQVWKVKNTKIVDGLSKNFLIFQLFTCIFWITYGVGFVVNYQYLDGGIILISNVSIITFTSVLIYYYNKYSKVSDCKLNNNTDKNTNKNISEPHVYHRKN